MAIIVKKASLSHTKTLFNDITFSIAAGERVALVGDNGCGKSTLLRALAGLEGIDSGDIIHPGGALVSYVEQDLPDDIDELTLYDVIEMAIPETERSYSGYKVEMILEEFGADIDMIFKPLKELSGGWQRLAMIGRAMMDDPALLLMDEPTNHLDMQKILLLEKWLVKNLRIPFLVVSHDRAFLDHVTTRTIFLRGGAIFDYPDPYSLARDKLAQRDILAKKQRADQEREAERLRKSIKSMKAQRGYQYSDSLKLQVKRISERVEAVEEAFTNIYIPPKRNIMLGNTNTHAKTLIRLENYDVSTPDGRLLYTVKKMDIRKGDRIVILGRNGTGKSQLVKRLAHDAHLAMQGIMVQGTYFTPSISLGYIDQQLTGLPLKTPLLRFFEENYTLGHEAAIEKLVLIGFSFSDQNKPIGTLSYGERARMAFLVLHLENPNLYILDEPSNHLDLDGQDRLEVQMLENSATCIMVSHDRRMVENLATRFFEIQRKRLNEVKNADSYYADIR